MDITCRHCGSTVEVTPTRFRCPECDADLRAQMHAEAGPISLPDDEVKRYYYQEAASLALEKKEIEALAIIARGLTLVDASELHLLAALLHRKRGEYDQMRRHVAAISVDDSLRSEAEWLLRAHQEQQRALREAAQHKNRGGAARGLDAGSLNLSDRFLIEEFGTRRRRTRRWISALGWAALLVLSIVALAWWQSPRLLGWPAVQALLLSWPVGDSVMLDDPAHAAEEDEQSTERVEEGTDASTAPPTPIPTLPPTATPPPNVVEALPGPTISPEPLAAASTDTAVLVTTHKPFDLATYLRLVNRTDLAEWEITANRNETTLFLMGTVPSTQARTELLDLAAEIPGIQEINGIDLLVRLPETYTIEEDDTLWSIAIELYGDGNRWHDLYDANQELLKGETLLTPGQDLAVPPLRD